MSSPTVTGAMIALFDASPAYGTVSSSGGLWFGELPADKELPWAILWHLGETFEAYMGTSYTERTSFLFELYHTSVASVEALAAQVKSVFDPTQDASGNTTQPSLSVSGALSFEVTRKNYNLIPASDTYRRPDGTRVIQANLEYDVRIVKQLRTSP